MVNNYALHNIETLRFWCRKVLPLVYDDSLSYYEVLCKVRAKLNEVIDNEDAQNEVIRQLSENVDTLTEAQTEQYNELLGMIDGAITSISALQTGKIDKAQSASDNGKVLGIVNGQVTPTEIQADNVFIATYGTTSYSEITNAITDGKIVFCKINNSYAAIQDTNNDTISFTSPSRTFITIARVTSANTWSNDTYSYSQIIQVQMNGVNPTSYNNIVSYFNAGKICKFVLNGTTYIATEHINNKVIFTGINGGYEILRWSINSSNVWTDETRLDLITYKQQVSDAGRILTVGADGIASWLPEKIFVGEYGTTTYAEVYQAAITESKFVVIGNLTSMKYYTAAYADLQGRLYFTCDNKLVYIDPVNGWSNEIDNSPVFYATENETTFDEIAKAYRAGKVCCINDGNDIYTLSYIAFDTGASFAHPTANGNSFKGVDINDVWN